MGMEEFKFDYFKYEYVNNLNDSKKSNRTLEIYINNLIKLFSNRQVIHTSFSNSFGYIFKPY